LYKIGEDVNDRFYIVIVGKLTLLYGVSQTQNIGKKLGSVTAGDCLGEEAYFSHEPCCRKETVLADEDKTYVLELTKESLNVVKDFLKANNLNLDWFTLNNFLKKTDVQKRAWR
jgi:CRP-like cAMP-binding protein